MAIESLVQSEEPPVDPSLLKANFESDPQFESSALQPVTITFETGQHGVTVLFKADGKTIGTSRLGDTGQFVGMSLDQPYEQWSSQIHLSMDHKGGLCIDALPEGSDITLVTEMDVTIRQKQNVHQLEVTAPNISIRGGINVSAKEQNSGLLKLNAHQKLSFSGNANVRVEGIFSAAFSDVELTGQLDVYKLFLKQHPSAQSDIINLGEILCQKAYVNGESEANNCFVNRGHIAAYACFEAFDLWGVENHGTFEAGRTYFKNIKKVFENLGKFIANSLRLVPARFKRPDKSNLDYEIHLALTNSGTMAIKEIAWWPMLRHFHNALGALLVTPQLSLDLSKGWSFMEADPEEGEVAFSNDGEIVVSSLSEVESSDQVDRENLGKFRVTNPDGRAVNRGVIQCGQADWSHRYGQENYGVIDVAERGRLASSRGNITSYEGSEQGYGEVSMTANGASLGGHTEASTKMSYSVKQAIRVNGKFIAKALIGRSSHAEFSEGSNTAIEEEANISADTMTVAQRAKLIANNVVMNVREVLENAGIVKARTDITSRHKPVVHNTGTFSAGRYVDMDVQSLQNEGTIEAGQMLLLKAVLELSSSENAKLAAREQIKLMAGRLELAGAVSETQRLLLRATESLVVECGTTLKGEDVIELISRGDVDQRGNISSDQRVVVNAIKKFEQLAGASIRAKRIDVRAGETRNLGELVADEMLTMKTGHLNQLAGSLLQAQRVELEARQVENAGKIEALDTLEADITLCLHNIAGGDVRAGNKLVLKVGQLLENAGNISSNDHLVVKAGGILRNFASGEILSRGRFDCDVDCFLENHGAMASDGDLTLKVMQSIRNCQGGKITSKQAIKIMNAAVLENAGEMRAEGTLTATVRHIIKNCESGVLQADEALKLIGAFTVDNAGLVQSELGVWTEGVNSIANAGTVDAEHGDIELVAASVVRNEGVLKAKLLQLNAQNFIKNSPAAQMIAKEVKLTSDAVYQSGDVTADSLEVFAKRFTNEGEVNVDHLTLAIEESIYNLAQGKITVRQLGEMLCGEGFYNLGGLFVEGELTKLKAKRLFNADNATLSVREKGMIEVVDCLLQGNIETAGQLALLVENDFHYKKGVLSAEGILELHLKDGNLIRYDVTSPGGLVLNIQQGDEDFVIDKNFNLGTKLEINAPGRCLKVGVPGRKRTEMIAGSVTMTGESLRQANATVVGKEGKTEVHVEQDADIGQADAEVSHLGGGDGLNVTSQNGSVRFINVDACSGGEANVEAMEGEVVVDDARLSVEDQLKVVADRIRVAAGSTVRSRRGVYHYRSEFEVGRVDENTPDSAIRTFAPSVSIDRYMQVGAKYDLELPQSYQQAGTVYADEMILKGEAGSHAYVGGILQTRDDMIIDAPHMVVQKRQYCYNVTATNTSQSSSCFGFRKKRRSESVTIRVKESQAGGELIAGGQIIREHDTLQVIGGLIFGRKGVFSHANENVTYQPNVDVSVRQDSSSARTWHGRGSSVSHHAQPVVRKSQVIAIDGSIVEEVDGTFTSIATDFLARRDIRISAETIRLLAQKYTMTFGPRFTKKSGMLTETTATAEGVETNTLQGGRSVELKAKGTVQSQASLIAAGRNVVIEGGDVFLEAVKMQMTQSSRSSGISGLTLVDQTVDELIETASVNRLRAGCDVRVTATNGDVDSEATQVSCQGDYLVKAKRHIRERALELRNERTTKTSTFGVSVGGLEFIEAAMQKDFAQAAELLASNVLPPAAHLKQLLESEEVADDFVYGIKSVYSSYVMYQQIAEAGSLSEYAKGKLDHFSSLGKFGQYVQDNFQFSWGKTTQREQWTELMVPWIMARNVIMQAEGNIHTESMQVDCENFHAKANNITMIALAEKYQSTMRHLKTTLGMKGGNPFVGLDVARHEQKAINTVAGQMRVANSMVLDATGDITLKGMEIEAFKAVVSAQNLYIETLQDTSESRSMSGHVDTAGGASYSQSRESSRRSNHHAGITAHNMLVNIAGKIKLVGGHLVATAQNETPLVAHSDEGDHQFYEYFMPGANDSLLHCMQITREAFTTDLVDEENYPQIRDFIKEELKFRLLNGDVEGFPEALLARFENFEGEGLENYLNAFCESDENIVEYITEYLNGDNSIPHEGPRQGTLAAIAHLSRRNIRIWQTNEEGELHSIANFRSEGAEETVDIRLSEEGNYNLLSTENNVVNCDTVEVTHLVDEYEKRSSSFSAVLPVASDTPESKPEAQGEGEAGAAEPKASESEPEEKNQAFEMAKSAFARVASEKKSRDVNSGIHGLEARQRSEGGASAADLSRPLFSAESRKTRCAHVTGDALGLGEAIANAPKRRAPQSQQRPGSIETQPERKIEEVTVPQRDDATQQSHTASAEPHDIAEDTAGRPFTRLYDAQRNDGRGLFWGGDLYPIAPSHWMDHPVDPLVSPSMVESSDGQIRRSSIFGIPISFDQEPIANVSGFNPALDSLRLGRKAGRGSSMQTYARDSGKYIRSRDIIQRALEQKQDAWLFRLEGEHVLMDEHRRAYFAPMYSSAYATIQLQGEASAAAVLRSSFDFTTRDVDASAELGGSLRSNILRLHATGGWGAVEATLDGPQLYASLSGTVSTEHGFVAEVGGDLGVIATSVSGKYSAPKVRFFGFALDTSVEGSAGCGAKVAGSAGVSAFKTKPSIAGHVKLGLFKGLGAQGKISGELSIDPVTVGIMNEEIERRLSEDTYLQQIEAKAKRREFLDRAEVQYLEEFGEEVANIGLFNSFGVD